MEEEVLELGQEEWVGSDGERTTDGPPVQPRPGPADVSTLMLLALGRTAKCPDWLPLPSLLPHHPGCAAVSEARVQVPRRKRLLYPAHLLARTLRLPPHG